MKGYTFECVQKARRKSQKLRKYVMLACIEYEDEI